MRSFYNHAKHLNNSQSEWFNLKEDLIRGRRKEAFSQLVARFIDLMIKPGFFTEFQLRANSGQEMTFFKVLTYYKQHKGYFNNQQSFKKIKQMWQTGHNHY